MAIKKKSTMKRSVSDKKTTNRKPSARSARTRDHLLSAAIGLIAESGEEAISVAEVARRAGVTRPGAYYHFKSKEELLEAVREELDGQLLHTVDGSLMCRDPYSVVAAFAAEEPELMRLRVMRMIEDGVDKDSFILYHKKVFRQHKKQGRLRKGVDPDIAAIIYASTLASAVLAVSEAKSFREKREIAHRYGKTYHRLFFYGHLDGVKFKDWKPKPEEA